MLSLKPPPPIPLRYVENGSLGQTLKAFGKLNERLVSSYTAKILEGLAYLHNSDVIHCDLKAANILTTKNGNVKLSDFGVSMNVAPKAMQEMKGDRSEVAGTPHWSACSLYLLLFDLSGPHRCVSDKCILSCSGSGGNSAQRSFSCFGYLVIGLHGD